jgi:hypothetical protein
LDQRKKKENLILGNEFLKFRLLFPTSNVGETRFEHRLSQRLLL